MEELLHGDEKGMYGDKAYVSAERKQKYEAQGVKWYVARKGVPNRTLSKKGSGVEPTKKQDQGKRRTPVWGD
jgi:IS5 family transposase